MRNNTGLDEVVVTSANGKLTVGVLPNYGGAINRLDVLKNGECLNLIDGYSNKEEMKRHRFKGVCLAPFPNRIKDGEFELKGKTYQLDCNDKFNHAMHGLVYNQPMKYQTTSSTIALDYMYEGEIEGYPFPFQMKIIYRILDYSVEQEIQLTNLGNINIPVGLGWHPYFSDLGLGVDQLKMKMSNAQKVEVDERKIPTGQLTNFDGYDAYRLIGDLSVDHCFVINAASRPVLELNYPQYNFTLSLSINNGNAEDQYIQLYIPKQRNAIAIEPMTCIPDAFNNGVGLKWLAPNTSIQWSCKWEISE